MGQVSAAELRQAAETLRERANAALDASDATEWWNAEGLEEAMYSMDDSTVSGIEEDAAHLSLYTPEVGLALADWLDLEATALEQIARHLADKTEPKTWPALRAARLINGGAA